MRTIRRVAPISVLVTALVFLMVPGGPAHAGTFGPYRPDAAVKGGGLSLNAYDYQGYLIFNTTGQLQQVKKRIHPGQLRRFTFIAMNDGDNVDDLYVQGCASDPPVKVRYFDPFSGLNITSNITGGWWYTAIAQGNGAAVVAKIKLRSNASSHGSFTCRFQTWSAGDSFLTDVAKAKVYG